MIYASACDGIGAVHVAWEPLGWRCAWTAEIEPFPAAVVDHHYGFPNLNDITEITDEQLEQHGSIDLLVGGTPCQDFSVAGLRAGMAAPRGNLALAFLGLAARARPEWVVWENVPGVLSSNDGRDFGTFLGALGELGYGFAYRVLDAQHFGVPQRRRRVFVVGNLGDWRRAAAVLFERTCLSGNPPPGKEAGQDVTRPLTPGSPKGSGYRNDAGTAENLIAVAPCLTKNYGKQPDNSDPGQGYPAIAVALRGREGGATAELSDVPSALRASQGGGDKAHVLAFKECQSGVYESDVHPTIDANKGSRRMEGVRFAAHVRRLTPRECERLQGFPDDFTAIPYRNKPAADGPRYKALGNSMAVPVMAWIGSRIIPANNGVLVVDAPSPDP